MKNHITKHIAMLLSLCLILGILVPIPVVGAGETLSVVLSSAYLVKSDQPQTVEMYVRVSPAATNSDFSYKVTTTDPISVSAVSATHGPGDLTDVTGDSTHITVTDQYTQLGSVTFTIPANAVGEFELGVEDLQLYVSGAHIFNGKTASVVLTVVNDASQLPAQGRTATLNGPASAFTGGTDDAVTYNINITGDTYQSAEIKLAYDSTLLEFDEDSNPESMSAQNGVVTIVQYGENQTPSYTVKFKAIGTGTANVTLTSAAFGTSDTAVSGDLTPADIDTAAVSTVINKAVLTVKLPEGVTGTASVNYGESYTFTLASAEPAKYDYAVNATMDGQPVAVVNNNDGTYTIAGVTGDLVITVMQTAKKYTVAFTTKTVKTALPASGDVTYGDDYTFTIPTEDGCTLAVTSATIGEVSYTCAAPVDGKVTIPGDVIVGNIVINIERVSATVTIDGTGAADADGAETAQIGDDYTLTLTKDVSYNYTVTATMDGTAVMPAVGTNTYTIQSVTGPIVFNIDKTINTTAASVSEYMKLSGTSIWLVKNTVEKLSGSVYTYNGTEMIWSEAYNAYCCLVISATEPTVSDESLRLISGTADELAFGLDVNQSNKVDANDAQLIYDLYNGKYTDFSVVTMEKFLLADTNETGTVDTNDVVVVIKHITGQ